TSRFSARRRDSPPSCTTGAASSVEGSSPPPPDVASFAAHGLEYVGLLAGIGAFVVRRVGRFRPRIAWGQPPMESFFLAAVAGGVGALATLEPPEGWGSAEARVLLERFGRVAMIAAGVTALTGVLRATEQLQGLSDLWMTAYGVVLALKVAGVLAVVVLSVL